MVPSNNRATALCGVCDSPVEPGGSHLYDARYEVAAPLCAACAEETARHCARRRLACYQRAHAASIKDRLETLQIGPVVTVLDDAPHALPHDYIREWLKGTAYEHIWD